VFISLERKTLVPNPEHIVWRCSISVFCWGVSVLVLIVVIKKRVQERSPFVKLRKGFSLALSFLCPYEMDGKPAELLIEVADLDGPLSITGDGLFLDAEAMLAKVGEGAFDIEAAKADMTVLS